MKTSIYDTIILNNQRRQNKTLSDKYKAKKGHLPNIVEDNVTPPSTRGQPQGSDNRTIYGNYNFNKTFYKPSKRTTSQGPVQQPLNVQQGSSGPSNSPGAIANINLNNLNAMNNMNMTMAQNMGGQGGYRTAYSGSSTAHSGYPTPGKPQAEGNYVRSKLNSSIQMAKNPQDGDYKPLTLSLEGDQVNLDNESKEQLDQHSPHKNHKVSSKYSNFTNVSTNETFMGMSKDILTPYGTKSDLNVTSNLTKILSDKDISDGLRKELVTMKEQMERNIAAYEKRFDEMVVERQSVLEENEYLSKKTTELARGHEDLNADMLKLNGGLNQSLNEITKLEFDHKAELERAEVKMRLLEETLNKRNDKYSILVKEYQHLTKQIDFNEKSRNECEKRIGDNGEKLKKRLEDLNRSNNINYKDTIEMLYEKINQLSNLLSVSEEKNIKYENQLKGRGGSSSQQAQNKSDGK